MTRLERAADDVVERDAAGHAAGLVEDDVRKRRPSPMPRECVLDRGPLTRGREVTLVPRRLPWGEEVPVRANQLRQDRDVAERDKPGGAHPSMLPGRAAVTGRLRGGGFRRNGRRLRRGGLRLGEAAGVEAAGSGGPLHAPRPPPPLLPGPERGPPAARACPAP